MNEPWLILLKRYGEEISTPSDADLDIAAKELFHESLPGMTEADYAEHGDAHLRLGYDDGPMYVLEATREGEAILEQWEDQDYENELCPPRTIEVTEQKLRSLWSLLKQHRVDEVRKVFE